MSSEFTFTHELYRSRGPVASVLTATNKLLSHRAAVGDGARQRLVLTRTVYCIVIIRNHTTDQCTRNHPSRCSGDFTGGGVNDAAARIARSWQGFTRCGKGTTVSLCETTTHSTGSEARRQHSTAPCDPRRLATRGSTHD